MMLSKRSKSHSPRIVRSERVTTKNELSRVETPGFQPCAARVRQAAASPASITDEAEKFGTHRARYDETSPFYLRHEARLEARKVFIHLDTSRKAAKALQRNAAPIVMPNTMSVTKSCTGGTTSPGPLQSCGPYGPLSAAPYRT